jgi:hypothetical protein
MALFTFHYGLLVAMAFDEARDDSASAECLIKAISNVLKMRQRKNTRQDAKKVCPVRPQHMIRRCILCSIRGALKQSGNAAGGLFRHPARPA